MHGWSLGGCNNCPNRLVTLFVLLPSQMFVVEMVSVTYHHVLSITCTRICYFVCVCFGSIGLLFGGVLAIGKFNGFVG